MGDGREEEKVLRTCLLKLGKEGSEGETWDRHHAPTRPPYPLHSLREKRHSIALCRPHRHPIHVWVRENPYTSRCESHCLPYLSPDRQTDRQTDS